MSYMLSGAPMRACCYAMKRIEVQAGRPLDALITPSAVMADAPRVVSNVPGVLARGRSSADGVDQPSVSRIGTATTTATSGAVGVHVSIVSSARLNATSAAVATGANRHGITLDHATMGKAGRIHAIIGRKVPTNIEGDEGSALLGRAL
jgi:hypothetical protein